MTALPSRRTDTVSLSKRNSLGRRTAWLLPVQNTFALFLARMSLLMPTNDSYHLDHGQVFSWHADDRDHRHARPGPPSCSAPPLEWTAPSPPRLDVLVQTERIRRINPRLPPRQPRAGFRRIAS